MKKTLLLLIFMFTVLADTFATDQPTCGPIGGPYTVANCTAQPTDCSSSTNAFIDAPSDVCGYTDTTPVNPSNVCAWIAAGNHYTQHAVFNCFSSFVAAPINSGLIFLIIAGAVLGFFMLRRQALKDKMISQLKP